MAILDDETVKSANRRRLDEQSRERAAGQIAKEQAQESDALYRFSLAHAPGERAKLSGLYTKNEANDRLLIETARQISIDGILDDFSLEAAYTELMRDHRLSVSQEPYERRTDTKQSRGPIAQVKHPAPPDLKLPYTRSEVLSWSTERLRAEMAKSPAHVKSLNAILAERQ